MAQHNASEVPLAIESRPIELRVEYKRLNTFFADYLKNIRRGGTFIKTQRPLEVGTEFLFHLLVPKLEEPIVLRGQVERVISPGVANKITGMGIRFLYYGEPERMNLLERIEKLMVQHLGQMLYAKLMQSEG